MPAARPPTADLNDLHVFDPALLAWAAPATTGVPPSPRDGQGFAAVGGGIYVFGGGHYDRTQFSGGRLPPPLAWPALIALPASAP
jgi:hypothetical protein